MCIYIICIYIICIYVYIHNICVYIYIHNIYIYTLNIIYILSGLMWLGFPPISEAGGFQDPEKGVWCLGL